MYRSGKEFIISKRVSPKHQKLDKKSLLCSLLCVGDNGDTYGTMHKSLIILVNLFRENWALFLWREFFFVKVTFLPNSTLHYLHYALTEFVPYSNLFIISFFCQSFF